MGKSEALPTKQAGRSRRYALVFLGRIIEPAHNEDRWLVLGQDTSNRRLALVFTRRSQRLRPVSCRPMRVNERKIYEEAIQEDEQVQG